MMEKVRKFHFASFGEKETYFLSDVCSEGKLIAQRIRSKLILNEINNGEPVLLLYPPKEDLHNLSGLFEVEIKGHFEDLRGGVAGEINIPKAYVGDSRSTSFGPSWEESVIEITPDEIYQKHSLGNQRQSTPRKANIVFSLTENRMLRPWGIIEKSFTGEVKSKLKPRVTLNFEDGWVGAFESYYKYIDTKIEEIQGDFSSSNLVLDLKKENYDLLSIGEIQTISQLLDKLMIYLSFGSSQKTTWISWTSEIGIDFVEYYRNVVIPQKLPDYGESLISKRLFQEFSQYCLDYLGRKGSLDLYLPLLFLVGADNPRKTIESEFLSLFISFEALLNLYSEEHDKAKLFKGGNWENIKVHIEKAINEIGFLEGNDKVLLANKIGLFNQASIKFLYDDFCKVMEIDNSDLWPVFGEGLSLSKIRNKLIHGASTGDEIFLNFAGIHLKWIIERSLLAMIGWKSDSNVDSDTLSKYNPYREWKQFYK